MNKSGALLSDAERHQVAYEWNRTQAEYPKGVCIHELFEAQVKRTPEATAVVFGDERISYGELNRRANRWAHYLQVKGVKPEKRVGICAERSVDMVVGLLAVLKAGGAYVPLDAEYPEERLQYMVKDSEPVIVLAQRATADLVRRVADGIQLMELDGEVEKAGDVETNLECASVGLTPENLAYVIYTSGSTGLPKGVMLAHRNTVNLIHWAHQAFSDDVLARTLFSTSLNFDLAVYECLVPLTIGTSICLVSNALDLTEREMDVTLVNTVPSVMKGLLEEQALPPRVRAVNVAGEPLKRELVERIFADTEVEQVCNLYGPTETTTYSTWVRMRREDGFAAHIGQPIANTYVYVLNNEMDPAPVETAGEIYIGGAGVARGYLNRNDLTAERFIPDPYIGQAGERMYKTGDMGRWLADGNLEFLGRNDDQVKIRGFRIELGEIAARLQEHPAVEEAVVVAQEDTLGEKRLVAYYVMDTAYDPLRPKLVEGLVPELRRWLETKLPEYMVPPVYVRIEQMPLNANGKLDRKSLPAPGVDAYAAQAYEAPQEETERMLAEIWAELLQVKRVGRRDDFFALGGHSLLATRVATRIRQKLGVAITLGDLFAHPVLVGLARSLKGAARSELPEIVRVERGQRLPLSFAQQRLWFLAQMKDASQAYHVPMGLYLKGELDVGALRRALDRIVARHEALRTTFVSIDGEPWQHIASAADSRFHLLDHDLRQHRTAKAELDCLLAEEAAASFDLQAGPLIRGRLIRQSEQEYTLLITMHHIVSDGWSMGVFLNEVSQLYSSFKSGEEDLLPELTLQYADYAVWERQWLEGEELRQQCEYWKKALQDAPALLELPTDYARPPQQNYKGGSEELALEQGLTEKLKKLSRRQETTLYMTLLAGWAALLSRLSGQTEVVIGTPMANRGRAEIEGLIGFFVNTLALRVDVGGGVTVKELLKRVKEVALGAQQNHNLPFERVVETVRPERSLSYHPLFQVTFGWQNMPEEAMMLPGVEAKPLKTIPYQPAKFELTLDLQEADGTIIGKLEYSTALFEPSTIKRYVGYFRRLLEGMVTEESEIIDRLSLLSDREREQVLYQWNDTQVECPSNKLVHELFAEQVDLTPEAPAVEYDGRQLTYRELNHEANRLAHYLQILGVKPEARVAICVERGLEMIIGLMAILKAGGAYVPLDPAYPQERLQYMLKDSEPVVLLTQPQIRERMGPLPAGLPTLDLTDAAWNSQQESNPEIAGSKPLAGHLAYVLYTSGSTGKPKGVMVSHRNLVSSTFARNLAYGKTGRFLLLSPISFDSSVAGIFGSLLHGGTLIIAPDDIVRDPLRLNQEVQRLRVESLLCVPSLYRYLLEYPVDGEQKKHLSRVIVAGEVCPPDLVAKSAQQYPQVELFNEYGPTEGTVWASMHRCTHPLSGQSVPIGRPIANTRVYILDTWGEPVPVGVTGELCIGGTGVTRGYLHRPVLTAERFVPDPYAGEAGARMYKTGDVGRWLADGNLEFVERNDDQVKIRGFRIELGEIAARLQEHPAVEEAAVVAREDAPGEKRLVAYFRPASRHGFLDPESLLSDVRSFLREHLPEYMVPAAYVRLESLPLTPNGKLDRRALPAPNGDAYAACRYVPPQGNLETVLAAIWAEVLKLKQVGRHDDFFALGGHSLLALRVLFRVNDCFQTELSVPALLEHSVLMDFAQKLRSISGRPMEELEKIAKIWLKIRRMTPEELKAALAVH
ncbi:MAG TPA: amino acid adenylation domain-containing protein [Candidatus Angelobacter sp.]|nr:amino acid adenylation domain-containing protein [Candidatus Angelobacter sp.]